MHQIDPRPSTLCRRLAATIRYGPPSPAIDGHVGVDVGRPVAGLREVDETDVLAEPCGRHSAVDTLTMYG
jgi:hypothetical protein